MSLTQMQRRYIWLMGSFPTYIAVQGRGKRTKELLYALDDDAQELVLFGYSTPFYWMEPRFVRKGQAPNSYVLTDAGEAEFARLRAAGGVPSEEFRKVRLAPRVGSL